MQGKVSKPQRALTAKPDFQVPNVERALEILELLSHFPAGLILTDVADKLGIPKKSCSRILLAMEHHGFLKRGDKDLAFRLSSKLLQLGCGSLCERNLMEEALPVMQELRDSIDESVLLGGVVGEKGVVLEAISSRRQIRLVVDPGVTHELYCSAPGKVYLAFCPEGERRRLMECQSFTRHTAATITGAQALLDELAGIREAGHALDLGEVNDSIRCASAPIFGRNRSIKATLTISGMSGDFSMKRLHVLAVAVKAAAELISKRLL